MDIINQEVDMNKLVIMVFLVIVFMSGFFFGSFAEKGGLVGLSVSTAIPSCRDGEYSILSFDNGILVDIDMVK